ncbi:hypothetical protein [Bacteroides cellulosilyticus]|jgi:hypothetical protein|uniref:hypothetical protein n=1 Tax=Bacteroides cellulosilyticus TaxID=246787 RepID=UPI00189F4051|nr:hypothetical protein [Bacteroides cellulosilyticus]
MSKSFIEYLIEGDNYPESGSVSFTTSDHVRFQNGQDVSGHNYNCNRKFVIEKNIQDNEGYTVTLYNLDGIHPLWQNNVQMAPKQMRIVSVDNNVIEMRGYGYDQLGASFEDYGVFILISNGEIERLQLNMLDRNTSIVYLK